MSIQHLHQKMFSTLFKGRVIKEIDRHVQAFLDQELETMLYEPTIQRLKEAEQAGHYTLILSSSPDFLVRPIAARLGVDAWKASLYTCDHEGKLNGISEVVEGEVKADYVHSFIKYLNLAGSTLAVYSDSYLDLPVLQMAGEGGGRAIGVSPDRYLRQICLRKGWEIL